MKIEMKNAYRVQLDEQELNTLNEAQNIINDIYRNTKDCLSEDDRDMFYAFRGAFETIVEWINESHQIERLRKRKA